MSARRDGRRLAASRLVRVLVAAALALGLAGGLTGAALGGVGAAASTESVLEHGPRGIDGGGEHGHPAGDRDDLVPVPAPAPARP